MLSPLLWLTQPLEVRQKLAIELNIPKTGGVVTDGGTVKSDGHSAEDLFEIGVPELQKFTDNPKCTDFMQLWDIAIAKVQGLVLEDKKNLHRADIEAEVQGEIKEEKKEQEREDVKQDILDKEKDNETKAEASDEGTTDSSGDKESGDTPKTDDTEGEGSTTSEE